MRADDRGACGHAARRAVLIVVFLLAVFAIPSLCEEALLDRTGVDALQETSRQLGGVDVRELARKLLSGQLALNDVSVRDAVAHFAEELRAALADALTALAAPVLACALLRALLEDRARGAAMALVCRLTCAALMMERFIACRAVAAEALSAAAKWIGAAAPVVASAMALTGAGRRAAILTPSAALCAQLIADGVSGVGLPLCSVAAAVAASANLSDRFRLDRLFALIRRGIAWSTGLMSAAFAGLLSLQGLLAAGQDTATARVVGRMVRAALPIIGGEVSDSSGVLLGSALAVRNAVGVAGVLAGISICALPIARITLSALSLKLASAVLEPVADAGMARVVGDFGEVAQLLAALCATGMLMSALCLGAFLTIGG